MKKAATLIPILTLVLGLYGGFFFGYNQSSQLSEVPGEDLKSYNREIFLDIPVEAH